MLQMVLQKVLDLIVTLNSARATPDNENIYILQPSTVTPLESGHSGGFTVVTQGVGHPSDYNLLPIKEFKYFQLNKIFIYSLNSSIVQEETPNYEGGLKSFRPQHEDGSTRQ